MRGDTELSAAVASMVADIAQRYPDPWRYIVAQTVLVTNQGREVRVSTARLTSVFLADLTGREVYETMLFQDARSFDCTWTATREDATEAHHKEAGLLRLRMALHHGEHVTREVQWPLQIEANRNA